MRLGPHIAPAIAAHLRDVMDQPDGLREYVGDDRIAAPRLAALSELLMLLPPELMGEK